MRSINKEMGDFINSIRDLWEVEALDGDSTEEITDRILRELDYINGNITEQEYLKGICGKIADKKTKGEKAEGSKERLRGAKWN